MPCRSLESLFSDDSECSNAGSGSFSSGQASSVCSPCNAGQFSSAASTSAGPTSCSELTCRLVSCLLAIASDSFILAHSLSKLSCNLSCSAANCTAGRFSGSTGQALCLNCPAGLVQTFLEDSLFARGGSSDQLLRTSQAHSARNPACRLARPAKPVASALRAQPLVQPAAVSWQPILLY